MALPIYYNDPLFDEENTFTEADDALNDYLARYDEIDLRMEHQADGILHKKELQQQITQMIAHVLTYHEAEIIKDYFGLQRKRLNIKELSFKYGSPQRAYRLMNEALEKLRYSDDVLAIWKYLYRNY